jgi:hypothetical protein
MIYELWDFDAANMIDTFRSKDAALAEVVAQVAAFGRDAVEMWVLLENDGTETEEGIRRIAYGCDLADLALRQAERESTVHTAD